ncbi:ABC transporter permease [Nesterenkonia ebinurensis]|uniref:ABC transporter permease n=1 Tax=Nesterenkonia ebinurensis TaxID=2608252 RepID=UPI00123E06EE|nr:ABC transporter permease [Nesterenkonia ebinurensis]
MMSYLLRRLGHAFITLFVSVVVIFFGVRALPGDTAVALAGQEGSPEAIARVRERYGLDDPLHTQFLTYLGNLLRGDLGRSSNTGGEVTSIIASALPATVQLAVLSMLVAMLVGISCGILAAVKQGKPGEWLANGVALFGLSVPNFWLGLLLILTFAVIWPVLPASGYTPLWEDPVDSMRRMVLPSIVLGTAFAAIIMRQTRAAMLETLTADFVRTARAKGIPAGAVITRHALRNSLITVITVVGLQLGTLISGAVVTEQVFGIPGFGKLTIDAIISRDYAMVQGVVLVTAAGYVLINLATDVVYSLVDPRIRVQEGN